MIFRWEELMSKVESGRDLKLSHFTIERAPDAIFWIDSEKNIYRVNEAACRLIGCSQAEIIGMEFHKLFDESEDSWSHIWAESMEKRIFAFETYLLTKDRRRICVDISGSFIEFDGKEYISCFVRNITQRKHSEHELRTSLAEVVQLKERLQVEVAYLQQEIKLIHNFEEIISENDKFKEILSQVEQVASTDSTVLIFGETGTGKELIARAIHNISGRRNRPMIKVNCAGLPENIIESELFGHEKGTFTGAFSRRIGRFELADGTTIFLDEISDLPIGLQTKILRVLQEGEFERLGSTNTIKVDARVISATNRDLEKAMDEGRFREDLYYRLNVFPINIPPLRERKDDIPLLVGHFVHKYNNKIGRQIERIPQEIMDRLQVYNWPGNVRELENVIERAVVISHGSILELGKLPFKENVDLDKSDAITLEQVEKTHILKVLELTKWRVSGKKGAAEILGINPQTLFSKMRKLGINLTK
jgi:formate hydrogenlyase transcriptional activator